jgi:hypothetical protein
MQLRGERWSNHSLTGTQTQPLTVWPGGPALPPSMLPAAAAAATAAGRAARQLLGRVWC